MLFDWLRVYFILFFIGVWTYIIHVALAAKMERFIAGTVFNLHI